MHDLPGDCPLGMQTKVMNLVCYLLIVGDLGTFDCPVYSLFQYYTVTMFDNAVYGHQRNLFFQSHFALIVEDCQHDRGNTVHLKRIQGDGFSPHCRWMRRIE